jgi:hypothetical protein
MVCRRGEALLVQGAQLFRNRLGLLVIGTQHPCFPEPLPGSSVGGLKIVHINGILLLSGPAIAEAVAQFRIAR